MIATPSTTSTTPVARFRVAGLALLAKRAAMRAHNSVDPTQHTRHHLEPNVLPGEQLGHSAGDFLFIINNNQFIHLAAPIRVQGKTVLSACPYIRANHHLYTSIKPFCPKGKTKITE